MRNRLSSLAAAALLLAGIVAGSQPASALPLTGAAALQNASKRQVENVRWHGRGWGIAAGVLGGALVGSAIANSYYYGPYGPGPYYYGPGPYGPGPAYYGPPVPDDAIGYCMSRFKSYDPRSGTYLGYDGYRHPCP